MGRIRPAADQEAAVQPAAMPGGQLRAGREAQALSVQDVAARLRLDARVIENLEADAYRDLPNGAYVRGYIRTYARLLNIDASPLLEAYDRFADRPPALSPLASMPEPQARAGDFPVKAITYLVVLSLAAMLALWSWQTHNLSALVTYAVPKWGQDAATPDTAASAAAATAAKSPAAAPQPPQIDYTYPVIEQPPGLTVPPAGSDAGTAGVGTAASAATPGGDAAPAAEAPAATSSPEAPAASVAAVGPAETATPAPPAGTAAANANSNADGAAAPASTPAADGQGLVLEVNTDDSWIDIFDGQGKKLYFNLAKKGSRISVQGQLPYAVRIGHAPAVTILYQGQPLDVSAFTHQGVAHFKVTAQGLSAP